MENTATTKRPNRLVELLLADRHSIPLSIALHLVPGAIIVAVYAFIAAPLVDSIGYPPFLAWTIALVIVLFPVQFVLLWLGKQRTGKYSLRGALRFMDKPVKRGKLIALIVFSLLWMTIVSLALLPLDNVVYDTLFSWIQYEGAGSSATTYLDGYSRQMLTITLLIGLPLTGWTLPLIEEYYFRGFLLPRLPQLGKWAPLFNVVLFSVYHFWAPWTVPSKLVFLFPGVWLAWKNKDIRISIGMHPGTTLLMSTVGVIAVAFGAMG